MRGGAAVFSASDGLTGLELWKSNGEAVGTLQVQDIAPGPGSSSPFDFTQAGAQVFFTADDNSTGRELWVAPVEALAVSAQEEIDELLSQIDELEEAGSTSAQRARQLANTLGVARDLIDQGNLTAAQALLTQFIREVERLIEKGDLAAEDGQPLIDGANAILSQIDGNQPSNQSFRERLLSRVRGAMAERGLPADMPLSRKTLRRLIRSGGLGPVGPETFMLEQMLLSEPLIF